MNDQETGDPEVESFGPHRGGLFGEYARLSELVRSDPEAAWSRLLEITAETDDAGLYWVVDLLEDLVIQHPSPYAARIEAELAVNPRLRRAFLDFVPMAKDEALQDHLAALRSEIEREFGVADE